MQQFYAKFPKQSYLTHFQTLQTNQLICYIQTGTSMPRQIKKHPQCIYGNQCVVFCVNPNCKKPGFICEKGINNRGECGLFHQNCQKMSWAQLDNIIYENPNTRTSEFTEFAQEMETLFSGLIKKIKDEHLKFKIFIRTFGYSKDMMKFIKQINDEDYDKITGNRLNDVISELFIKDQQKIHSEFIFDREFFEKINNQITECLGKISNIYRRPIDELRKLDSIPQPQPVVPMDAVDSKITREFEYIKSLFPANRRIKKFTKVFRASQNGFNVQAFHKRCDYIPHTVLLVETQFGKIIGGYTSLTWNSSRKHWTTDKELTSFIFSVSMKEKFSLNLSQFAIACNQQKGPIFGCCDICIVDRSDREMCNAEFPISYSNFKHTRCIQTNLDFIGSENGKFRTKQWEIFQVEFDDSA